MPEIKLPKLPPELELLIACSCWPLDASAEQQIQSRATAPIDWDLFLAWVRRHRIAPLVYRNLLQVSCPLIPDRVVLDLKSESTSRAQRALRQIAEAARLSRVLAAADISSIIVKGPTLAQVAMGDPILRESEDIDLVIEPTRVLEADRILLTMGYRRVIPDTDLTPSRYQVYLRRRSEFGYYSERCGLSLELHWRLTDNPLLMPTDAATLWSRSEQVRVAGVSLTTLVGEELFLYLCVHGSLHMWFRLKWLADIAALLQHARSDVIDRITKRARVLGVERSYHQALILAHSLMKAPVPREVLADAYQDKSARRLAIAACRALNWHESPEEPFESQWFSIWLNWHAFQFKPGLRFRWSELQNQMTSPEDWERVPLPKQLSFLYLPLRPISWATRHIYRLVSR